MPIKLSNIFLLGIVFITSFVVVYGFLSRLPIKLFSPTTKVLGKKTIQTSPTPTLTTTPSPTPIPTIAFTPTPTSTPRPTPIIIAPSDLEQLFVKYSSEYSVAKDLLTRIAYCESRLNPNAVNRDYAGLFQFTQSLWTQTRQLMGQNPDINLRFNPEEAIRTAAFLVSQGHLSVWPNCGK